MQCARRLRGATPSAPGPPRRARKEKQFGIIFSKKHIFAQRRDCEVKMTTSQRPGMLNVSVQETGHALDGAAAKYTDGVETTE